MALDALNDPAPRCIVRQGRCAVHGETSAEVEIAALRARVAELEDQLAAAPPAQPAPPTVPVTPSPPLEPATELTRITYHDDTESVRPIESSPTPTGSGTDGADPATAWADGELTFEERIAARAFFTVDGDEEPSRRWLLGSA